MITAERLKKLIEEQATIYTKYAEISLEKEDGYYWLVEDDCLLWMQIMDNEEDCADYAWDLESLFETEEDAEFALEIRTSKTMRFEPPLYEEFLKLRSFGFVSDDDVLYNLYYRYNKIFLEHSEDREFFVESKVWKLNKENYIEACRFCKKLFLGEEV